MRARARKGESERESESESEKEKRGWNLQDTTHHDLFTHELLPDALEEVLCFPLRPCCNVLLARLDDSNHILHQPLHHLDNICLDCSREGTQPQIRQPPKLLVEIVAKLAKPRENVGVSRIRRSAIEQIARTWSATYFSAKLPIV